MGDGMKPATKNGSVALMWLSAVAGLAYGNTAQAQDLNPTGLQLMHAPDWHAVGERTQVHHGSLVANPPRLDVWQRSALTGQYGDWVYVKVLIDCQRWTQLPFATLAASGRFMMWADADERMKAGWQPEGAQQGRIISALCGQYGYKKPRQTSPAPDADQNFVIRSPAVTR